MCLKLEDIDNFKTKSHRSENGKKNEERENMILKCFDCKSIPLWISKNEDAKKFINSLWSYFIVNFGASHDSKLEKKGGRQNKYDFKLINSGNEEKIEFKFDKVPQIANVENPSRFFQESFEKFYYNYYLKKFSEENDIDIPQLNRYLKCVGQNTCPELAEFQEKYYNGCKKSSKFTNKEEDIKFYNNTKKLSAKCIKDFIKNNDLNIYELSKYLNESQEGKNYMIYKLKKGCFTYIEKGTDYTIEKIVKKTHNTYIAELKNKKKIKILLRWKNGNGVCFPAFQIDYQF
jgi:hypothetical protein